MNASKAFVLVGDPTYRQNIASFLSAQGIPVVCVEARKPLAASLPSDARGCLIVSEELGGGDSGCDLIRQYSCTSCPLPSILMSDHPDVHLAISAFRAGVVEFIMLPVELERILAAVRTGFQQDRRNMQKRTAKERFTSVTDDEYQVISLMLKGATNRRIASRLHVGVRTVERLRSRILSKTGAASPLEMARLYALAFLDELPGPSERSVTAGTPSDLSG